MAGTTYGNVRGFRLRHGIPARWRGEGAAVPTPAPAQAPATKKPRKPRKGKLTPFLEELGILTDKVIGEKAGTTTQNVRTYRQRHGIPARWKGEGDPLPNEDAILAQQAGPSSQPKPARGTEPVHTGFDDLPPEADDVEASGSTIANASPAVLKAYKVKVKSPDGKAHFVATGTNIVDAAQNAVAALAARSTEGEVVEMRFLAGVLGL